LPWFPALWADSLFVVDCAMLGFEKRNVYIVIGVNKSCRKFCKLILAPHLSESTTPSDTDPGIGHVEPSQRTPPPRPRRSWPWSHNTSRHETWGNLNTKLQFSTVVTDVLIEEMFFVFAYYSILDYTLMKNQVIKNTGVTILKEQR
jgi:hypothetical protein